MVGILYTFLLGWPIFLLLSVWMFPKIEGKPPKMDGENNRKPYEQMDDLGGFPIFLGNTHLDTNFQIFHLPLSDLRLPGVSGV